MSGGARRSILSDELSSAVARWERACLDDPKDAIRLALALDPSLLLEGPARLHRHVLERTLALAVNDDDALARRVELLISLGRTDLIRGLYRTARGSFEEARRIALSLGDPEKEGWSSVFLGHAIAHLERGEEARSLARRAAGLAIDVDDARLRVMATYALGNLDLLDGRADEALRWYEQSLVAARAAGTPRLVGITLGNLSVAYRKRGEPAKSRTLLAEARRMFESAGDRFHLGKVAVDEAVLSVDGGAIESVELLKAALATVIEHGDIESEIEAREALVRILVLRSESAEAARRWEELSILVRSTESRVWRDRVEALRPPPASTAASLRLAVDGRRVIVEGRELDFGRRGPLRRILVALTRRHLDQDRRPLTTSDLLAAGWPEEKTLANSGAARVYMAVRRLRSLGLEAIVATSDEGYFLDPRADVGWLEEC